MIFQECCVGAEQFSSRLCNFSTLSHLITPCKEVNQQFNPETTLLFVRCFQKIKELYLIIKLTELFIYMEVLWYRFYAQEILGLFHTFLPMETLTCCTWLQVVGNPESQGTNCDDMQAICKHNTMCYAVRGFDYQVVRKGNCNSSWFFKILNPDYGQVLLFWTTQQRKKNRFHSNNGYWLHDEEWYEQISMNRSLLKGTMNTYVAFQLSISFPGFHFYMTPLQIMMP